MSLYNFDYFLDNNEIIWMKGRYTRRVVWRIWAARIGHPSKGTEMTEGPTQVIALKSKAVPPTVNRSGCFPGRNSEGQPGFGDTTHRCKFIFIYFEVFQELIVCFMAIIFRLLGLCLSSKAKK